MTVVHDPKPPSDPSSSGSRWGRRNRSTAGGAPWLPILGLIVIAAGVAVWWFLLRGSPEATGSEAAGPPSASVPTGVSDTGPAELPALDLPPLAESDAVVRRVVGAISAHPRWAEWLVTDDLALRFVSSVVNVAAGVSPASQVPFLAPEGDFAVVSSGAGTFIDPASYRRFDALVDAFVSFETTAAVDLYRQLLPLFDEAHRSLGFPEGTFNEVFDTALGRLTDVP
ncbi:MAG: DUF3014 domain-containing protein, partial [Gemmatimonadetes bacterium]|nr:DUF3014 domain-containing protein [Gemmatimonadota bacterium]